MKSLLLKFTLVILAGFSVQAQNPWIISAPSEDQYTQINRNGKTVIPNGRFVKPKGTVVTTAPHPYGLVLSQDGSIAVTANNGIRPISVSIIKDLYSKNPTVRQIPEGSSTDKGVLAAVYMGIAISPDNTRLYVAGGQEGKVFMFDLNTYESLGEIDCNGEFNGRVFSSSYIGDMTMSKNGEFIYAVDQLNFRMITIDTRSQKIVSSIGVGRYPFGICLSPDEKKAYVANVGMYEYKIAYTYKPGDPAETRIHKPVVAYLSEESEKGFQSDTLNIPALGDPLSPESFSVFSIDLDAEKVIAKNKTGILVGEVLDEVPAIGGSSPNSVVATDEYVFVSNGNNDCITVLDAKADTILRQVFLSPDDRLKNLRGMIPYGVAISPDQKRLYVAESGINAVGVINIEKMDVIGHIPAGWFPSKLQVSPDGEKLIIANAKGYGSGPNGGKEFEMGPEGSYVGNLMKGTVNIMDVPTDAEIQKMTKEVLDLNFVFRRANDPAFASRKNNPIPLYPGEKESPIKHIVFIAKENRTYDEVFGQLEGGKGDPTVARYGRNVTIADPSGDWLEGIDIAPNHLALAEQFALSDNFYVDSDVSVDGQRWLLGIYPNEWVETNVVNQYGGVRGYKRDSTAPGMNILAAGLVPEDYNEAGSIWFHLGRNNIPFFNFGLDLRITPYQAKAGYSPSSIRTVINRPVPQKLMENSSHLYPSYNMRIPDQFRADMLIQEFEDRWMNGKGTMPSMMTVRLPNDHGAGVRPDAGYPYPHSYMMDNDFALGRIVEYLSNTPYWKNMLIIVTEDDAQGGRDHVDAHRSVCLVISPWVKKGHVSHVHNSFGSIMKTFWNILGIPYLNQYDAVATDLADMFTSEPDYSPYKLIPVDPEVFNPEKALDPFDRDFDWEALATSPEIDQLDTMIAMSAADDLARINAKPFPPLFSQGSTRFLKKLEISLKNVVYDAEIRYTLDGSEPSEKSKLYTKPIVLKKTATIKAKSFFSNGKSSRTAQRNYTRSKMLKSSKVKNSQPGLKYKYYEGNFLTVAGFAKSEPISEGVVSLPSIGEFEVAPDHWAAKFEGYIEVPETAIYTFHLTSDDGSILYIDGQEVVNNDGSHSVTTRTGIIGMSKGKHKFRLDYFEDYDGESLEVEVEGANWTKQPIPAEALSY